jgi:carboxypeptidase A1
LEETVTWYKELASKHPDLVTLTPCIGKSFEGRDVFAVTLSGKRWENKPQIWVQGYCVSLVYAYSDHLPQRRQTHAREWISGAVIQFVMEQLVSNYGKDDESTNVLDQTEIIVVPMPNPDGFKYTWEEDRMWKKNRHGKGVDLNRNWDDHWGSKGASPNPNSETYCGTAPFSEPETKAISSFMLQHKNIVGALDLHSYAELLMRPAGWTQDPQPFDKEHRALGELMSKAISANGRSYRNIRSAELSLAGGVAGDWFNGETVRRNQGFVPYSFTIELSPHQSSGSGFLIPPEQISVIGREIFPAFQVFVSNAVRKPLQ